MLAATRALRVLSMAELRSGSTPAAFRLTGKQSMQQRTKCLFSDNKNKPEPRKQQGISLHEIWRRVRNISPAAWSKLGKLSLILSALVVGNIVKNKLSEEEYPINLLEDEFSKGTNNIIKMELRVLVSVRQVNYTLEFIRMDGKKYKTEFNKDVERLNALTSKLDKSIPFKIKYRNAIDLTFLHMTYISCLISSIFTIAYFLRAGNMQRGTKSKGGIVDMVMQKKTFDIVRQTGVKFADVAGLDQSKLQVQQFVDFLKHPEKYKKLGARIPKGVLLSGPPGTGKTMLAKACAGEAGVPFVPTSGSDFVEIYVGVGASRIRDLFETAKKLSPSIIFIDEIDAVGRKRSGSEGSHDERDNTLNQILVEMDGFDTNHNVIVMAATNQQNLLDNALVRPGRFDRIVEVGLPDLNGRREIFNVHLSKITLDAANTKDGYARRLAALTPGFSGAQIANLCNQAAIMAARSNKDCVSEYDFEMATERVIGGVEKRSILSTSEKRIVAVHECGHAVVSWFLEGANPLLKLTIIPRSKGALGFAQYFLNENKLNTKSQLIDRICFILGGRCAEEHFFGTVTNGAADDLRKAYEIAHNVVVKLGMNDQIGYVGFKDENYHRPYSNKMGAVIDQQIINLISQCTEKARELVRKHEKAIDQLSKELFEKETLTIKDIRKILGERDFSNHESYEKYLEIEHEQQLAGEKV